MTGLARAPAFATKLRDFGPPHVIPFAGIEGEGLGTEAIRKTKDHLARIGLSAMEVRGDIASRLLNALRAEAGAIIREQATTAQDADVILRCAVAPALMSEGAATETAGNPDKILGALIGALRDHDTGLGAVLGRREVVPEAAGVIIEQEVDHLVPVVWQEVLPSWIDYNGHMTDSRYLHAAGVTCTCFLAHIGAGLDYVRSGFSYYTAEAHLMFRSECKLGDVLRCTLQVLGSDAKRIHALIQIWNGDRLAGAAEYMMLHVDMRAARACSAPDAILHRLQPIVAAHAALPRPPETGRGIAMFQKSSGDPRQAQGVDA